MYAQAISRWSLTGTVHSNGSRCRQCLNGMIMQNPLDDDGIFGDFVNATPSYALDEAGRSSRRLAFSSAAGRSATA